MAQDERELLARLSPEETLLVHNYRVVNAIRQDTLLHFSTELVTFEIQDQTEAAPDNVILLSGRR